jgi:hypothetical protein
VQTGPVIETYDTEDKVVGQTSNHLSKRFRLAYSAPCYRGKLFDDLGFTGDTECSQQILEGTYDLPPDTDIWTKKILQEAHYTFSCMSSAEILTIITTEDFQDFWKRVDERMSSSFSGVTSPITRLLQQIRCYQQCTPHIQQHVLVEVSLLHNGVLGLPCFWRRLLVIILFTN